MIASARIAACAASMLALVCSTAGAETLPASAKKVTMDEFRAFADMKPVTVEIYDMGQPITADLVWNFKKKTITGTALVGGKTIQVKTKLKVDGDRACAVGEETTCHVIYVDGNRFFEVTADGTLHATSTLK
jgi:hypothetical protein